MAKFRIKFKLQGLELEVEGSREDIPVLRQAITEQVAGLVGPATDMAGGEVIGSPVLGGATAAAAAATEQKRTAKRKRSTAPTAPADGKETAINWRHDTTKYGSPMQGWTNADKAIWLLYVALHEAQTGEMGNAQLAATFYKHFKTAGPINKKNLPRDLGRFKVAQNGQKPLVSEDTTKNPPVWFLTEAGLAHAQKLIAQALGSTTEI